MKLDKTVEPLATDTTIKVRPRSALGLKYVELTPGKGKHDLAAGDTVPLEERQRGASSSRTSSRRSTRRRATTRDAPLEGFGDAFAGRGSSLNTAIEALNPFFKSLAAGDAHAGRSRHPARPVLPPARAAPRLRWRRSRACRPTCSANMADTFAAISARPGGAAGDDREVAAHDRRRRHQLLPRAAAVPAPTSPTCHGACGRPSNELPRSLPAINRAFRVGTPILPRTVDLNKRPRAGRSSQLEDLFENPNTLLALRDLRTTLAVTAPGARVRRARTRRSATTSTTSSTPLGEHQSTVCRAARSRRRASRR